MDTLDTAIDASEAVQGKRETRYVEDVLKLVSGTTIAQLLGILATPVLTRFYAPDAFGLLAIFTAITGILGVIACLRYELAIMLPESDEEATNLFGASLFFTVLISLLTVLVVWWGREPLLSLLNAPELGPYLWLIPPAVCVSGFFLALNYWNSRTKHFGRLSIARVTSSVATTLTKIAGGALGYATGGMLVGATVGGSALATIILGGQIWRDDRKLFLRAFNWQAMGQGIKRYRRFPLYDTWSALLNTASWQLPALLLSSYFSSSVVGYYALGYRILQLPMSFIGAAIGQVFFQRASEGHKHGKLNLVVESTFSRLVLIGLFSMLTVTLVGRDLFVIVFDEAWVEAGVYAQMLGPWAFFWFVSSPLSSVFIILERQDWLLKFNVANFLTRIMSLYVGGVLREPRLSILLFSSTGIFVYGYLIVSILREADVPLRRAIQILGKSFLLYLPVGIIFSYFSITKTKFELQLLTIGLLLICYFLILIKMQPALWKTVTSKLFQR